MIPLLKEHGVGSSTPIISPETIIIDGEEVGVVSPEGEARSIKLSALIERVAPPLISTCDAVLPDGVKCVIPIPQGSVLVHQTPPRVHSFEWITNDSPSPYGLGATYRKVSIALPYMIVLAQFEEAPGCLPQLGGTSECFFSNRPIDLEGMDTPLLYPALLNCSRFPIDEPLHPLAWICVQHLRPVRLTDETSKSEAIRKGLQALLHHLLESRFNLSSENHELSSWFSETVKAEVDPRLASIETWEQHSAENPLFALDVPWLPTGHTLNEVVQRMARLRKSKDRRFTTARDLMRVIFQESKTEKSAE